MNFLRRASRQSSDRGLSEDDLRALRQQRRKSSIVVAQTVSGEEPLFVTPIKPVVAIFPFSTYDRQQTLIISPDPVGKEFTIMRASTAEQFLTVSTPSLSIPAQSHAKQFYGRLPTHLDRDNSKRKDHHLISRGSDYGKSNGDEDATDKQAQRRNSQKKSTEGAEGEDGAETPQECPVRKLFTLERDTLSLRRRHHITDPYSGKKLLQIEFSAPSSWNAQALKANIELLNKFSDNTAIEPIRLKWQGKRNTLEGVLEIAPPGSTSGKPVAVCAKGEETADSGDYILYVAPGMDACVAVCVVMAVDDRTRRGSDDQYGGQGAAARPSKEDNVVWAEGYQ